MSEWITEQKNVLFQADGIIIDKQPRILLCASLFYFRIPRAYWKERMEQLKALGYNSIDVYFPWNYHELQEGQWDFRGERDVEAFLSIAAEVGLWVVARPGPYICSEWDGGALPAYLLTKDGMKLRDNNQLFLHYVQLWFDKIMPLLKAKQLGEGGTVVAIQLDNELDFYGCSDPKGYISALRDMTLQHGIQVPLFACSGQSGIQQAMGLASDVVPTCNFYPYDRDPEFEQKVLHYHDVITKQGYPLLVTETNRSHYLLRRLLSCGAKLLGPYLQVSGTDFGFTNATNNWGRPLAFMTSDYDFGGMISPEGHIRKEAYEGRLLARLMQTYGAALAKATASKDILVDKSWSLQGEQARIAGPQVLKLHGGGNLVFVSNLEDKEKQIAIVHQELITATFTLQGNRSLALPFEVPLSLWGETGELVHSNMELFYSDSNKDRVKLVFHAEGFGELVLAVDQPNEIIVNGASSAYNEGKLAITFTEQESSCLIQTAAGTKLEILKLNHSKALYMGDLNVSGITNSEEHNEKAEQAAIHWSLTEFAGAQAPNVAIHKAKQHNVSFLEQIGIYRGYAWYKATIDDTKAQLAEGILVRNGSDVLSLYESSQYAGTITPGGATAYIPFAEAKVAKLIQARVEIWGHSNFDDIRLPGLRLNSLKGLSGMVAVTSAKRLQSNWTLTYVQRADEEVMEMDERLKPIIGFGSWISPNHPALETYSRTFTASSEADSWTLAFQGLQLHAQLTVNGHDLGRVDTFNPYIDITPYVIAGEVVELKVHLERVHGLSVGNVMLYEGNDITDWQISSAETEQLQLHAEQLKAEAQDIQLPLSLQAGHTAWLYAATVNSTAGKGWRVKVEGTALKLTVMFSGQIIGRIWLPQQQEKPVMTGGNSSSFYIPGAWYEAGNGTLSILLEAVGGQEQGQLQALQFNSV